ncbi:pentatricopeptide repeat-containing protein At4g21880, mitochondrial-like isoform X1 [Selaginella moellendorffii]|uniref:pentatricopeptide repeat-containing protein At4g21880, mitochondrial-like isoform X1 n=1 Tax=Selaginella moellendorffii TaxID=88036 RepID=UPI000D1CE60C|nr:pentatricopeptide repeat-containing protein At4g21880, mitochondrial-like isoform X1 [Selaginella moellendorffii]|eukprot:XP_024535657.1 pentatricopeptide repeat-containing protein At4g21880, mitochondrial-like isoform X1 [Selaginella moellendorffii]
MRWRALASHSTARRLFSSSSIPACIKGAEDQILESWQNSNCSSSSSSFLSQASDSSHPLIQGISKLLQTQPGNPKFATTDLQKLHLKTNNPATLTLQRLRKRRWKQVVDMKPTQYLYLMSQWIKKGGAMIGQPMFQQMLKVGVEPVDAYTTMIRHFVSRARKALSSLDAAESQESREEEAEKCMLESLKYLHEMREKGITPNGSTYEPLVTWFLENDKTSEFEEILEWIKGDGLSCYTSLFKSFGRLGRYADAERYFTDVQKLGVGEELMTEYLASFVQGIVITSKLDVAIQQCGRMARTFKVTPSSTTYSMLINLACRSSQVREFHIDQALDLIQEMHEKGVQLGSDVFQPLMIAFLHDSHPEGVFELFAAMKRMNVQPSYEAYNYFLRASAKANNVEKMFSALREMKELRLPRTSETYNAVIQALGASRQYHRALTVLNDMENDSVKPDSGTMLELITCSPDSGKALEVFERLKTLGVKPTDSVYASLFSSLIRDGELDKALEMLKDPEVSFRIGINAKSTLLDGLAEEKRVDEALTCYDDILRDGKTPDLFSVGSLVRALGYAGKLDRMFELVDKHSMDPGSKKNDRFKKENKIRLLMVATKACVIHNELGHLETFLQKEQEFESSIIFDSIILDIANGEDKTCESAWSWKDGFALRKVMLKLNIPQSRIFLEALLDGCVAVKDANYADEIVEQMEADGLPLNGFSLVRLLRVYVVAEKVEKAASVLKRMKRCLKDEDIFLLAGQILNSAEPSFQRKVFELLELPE